MGSAGTKPSDLGKTPGCPEKEEVKPGESPTSQCQESCICHGWMETAIQSFCAKLVFTAQEVHQALALGLKFPASWTAYTVDVGALEDSPEPVLFLLGSTSECPQSQIYKNSNHQLCF